jgi:peptide/nickel transport system ATP-binding protein
MGFDTAERTEIERLSVHLAEPDLPIVEDVSLQIAPGELLALVGESGAGKTTMGLALLGFARRGARITRGTIRIGPVELTKLSERNLERSRGFVVSYVPQNPSTALNPSMRVGDQIEEVLEVHGRRSDDEVVAGLLERVALPTERMFRRRFPHQLSGGQQQRITIAMALACSPNLIVLDEPTTALDVITQERILALIRRLRDERKSAFVYVTHDIAAVAGVATNIAVMYAGRVVESGPRDAILFAPRHPYTQALIDAVPTLDTRRKLNGVPGVAPGVFDRPAGCSFASRCVHAQERCRAAVPELENVGGDHLVRCVRWREDLAGAEVPVEHAPAVPNAAPILSVSEVSAGYRGAPDALSAVSFDLSAGECLAIVGESGSGKTTLARCIVGLHEPAGGSLLLEGTPLAGRAQKRTLAQRRRIQIVFQNPDDSLNPRMRVRETIARPAVQLQGLAKSLALELADHLLGQVRLPARVGDRYPIQLSGGERQRVSLARALAAAPEVLLCDEITSALDVSVQAAVIRLLEDLRLELGLAMVFISHDLAVVSAIADRVLVLERGQVREAGATASVVHAPSEPYTRALVAAVPRIEWERS